MTTGLAVFDRTVQLTNGWLNDLEDLLEFSDRHLAYEGLRAVLHALRDRLPVEGVVHFSAQLPMLLRGVFFEGWRYPPGHEAGRRREEFLDRVDRDLPPNYPYGAEELTRAVFEVVTDRIDPGEVHKLLGYLPAELQDLWPEILVVL